MVFVALTGDGFSTSCSIAHLPALLQNPDSQSLSSTHLLFNSHGGQSGPPQSTSVSNPSILLLSHDGSAHTPSWQFPSWQSESDLHVSPTGHSPHPDSYPQSTPVSNPFCMPSSHGACWQIPSWQ